MKHALLVDELKEVLGQLEGDDFIIINRNNGLDVETANGKIVGNINLKTFPVTFEEAKDEDV